MSEQRMIDSNANVYPYVTTWTCNCSEYGVQNVMAVDDISTLPEIDTETLPIVQRLRAELADTKAERDELATLCGKLITLCDQPKEWQTKMFRRHLGPMIGDYMGSGYPFVDAFNRIFEEFVETASEGAYKAVRKETDKEVGKREPQKKVGKDGRYVAPVIKNRPSKHEIYEECKVEDGEVLYRKRIFVDENDFVEYCPKCGKRLCSRFNSFCPNCGANMGGEINEKED